ncbi:YuzL family protein [Metabacillus sediminilitoris]|jgi:hypothetical protein|uniref:YuzL family protein n=1 Tax=Metabacillus sediminilitoris TaxID=2567941 RepID=A0A4S4BME5_9BACI|nr:YuzL family protein [Metabacillus sediminilitoris]QGQ46593.1 YuzL family protein [Metabacillus sediminilitoris]THF75990.1 YuzL family protein [Metabacillus sediminilitoris]
MTKRKVDPSREVLGSPNVEGQGTTNNESESKQLDSARKKKKRV